MNPEITRPVRGRRSVGATFLARAGVVVGLAAVLGCAGGHRGADEPATVPARPAPPREPVEESEGASGEIGVHHAVEQGQTLWRIARTYGVPMETILEANEIADPERIASGTTLWIPGARERLVVPRSPAPQHGSSAGLCGTKWEWPVAGGGILSYFGAPRRTHRHQGLDIGGRHGQRVAAARAGRVVYRGSTMRGYGKTIILDHGEGLSSLYAHNSDLLVRNGQRVERGQPIARVGRSGNASTDHCHFEIRHRGIAIDPLPCLSLQAGSR